MKKLVPAFAGLLLVGGIVTAASAQTKWDMPTPYPEGNFHTKNIIQFAADVEKATDSSLKIIVHSAGSLIKHPEIKRAVRQGTAPIGEILESLAANEAPVYDVDSIPFVATSYDAAKKLYAAQKPYLEKQLASEGLMLLYSVPWPPQGLYAKKEIKSVVELKGLKFRTYNAMTSRMAALAGGTSSQTELPEAMAQGDVDAMFGGAFFPATGKDFIYFLDLQASLPRNVVFVNKAAFDKLTPAQQSAVKEAAKAAEERGWKMSMDVMTAKISAHKSAGIKVIVPSTDLRDGFHAIGGMLAGEWVRSAGAAGGALLVEYKKM